MWAAYPFQFGTLYMEFEGDILYHLRCIPGKEGIVSEFIESRSEFSDDVFRQVEEFLSGARKSFDIKYKLICNDFCQEVNLYKNHHKLLLNCY